ncbi:cyclic dehypoxanthinyl futalosine synthase [Pendulispora albinea]|uniref:Multifunctional fusion protein n=1 Tax=Pendulispora albinea TaxID=2741071 RepID=A0ABZ2LNG7_9BACT
MRVSAVQYLNARPLYEPLLAKNGERAMAEVELDLAPPAEVARRIAEEETDVGLVPVAALAQLGDTCLVRGAAIAARGPVRSVLLVSEVPIDDLTDVVLDATSRTSSVLARLVLRARRAAAGLRGEPRVRVLPPDVAVAEVKGTCGALIIGDKALDIEDRFAHKLDLGAAWLEWTGLPFVFAAWGGRAGALAPGGEQLLLAAKREGLARRDAIADAYAAQSGLDAASLRSYLQANIHYDFGDDERRGLERFYLEGHRAGLLPATPVRFYDDAPRGSSPVYSPPSLDTILSRAAEGDRLNAAEGERLLHEAPLFELGLAADAVRRRKHPHGVVTYIVDRNVNYTNVCTTSCRFCAFYRPVGHPEGYVLSREVLRQKLDEVVQAGGVQILLQGGLNPELRIGYYEDLFRWIKSEFKLGLHALSPEEIIHISQLESLSVREVLERLHSAGLDSVPGGGAEILVDRVRRKIAKAKCTSAEWLDVMRVAHHMGLRSSATMMYGTVDTARDRILHLVKLRELQDETRGFTAFFCWDFQHEQGVRITAGDTGTHLYLRQQAVARLMLDNIDHVGASWVTQGPDVGQVALRFGADDFGSVMFEENVVSSAGTTFCINAEAIEQRIRAAGFRATRRNVKYEWLTEPA